MSCPGLVAKSGISWTLRAGQDGQAGGGGYQDQDTRNAFACATWGEGDAERCPEGGKAFGPRYQDEGRRELGSLAGPGGLRWDGFWVSISGILGDSSGGSHHGVLSGELGAFWPFSLAFSLWWFSFPLASFSIQFHENPNASPSPPLHTAHTAPVKNVMVADDGPPAPTARGRWRRGSSLTAQTIDQWAVGSFSGAFSGLGASISAVGSPPLIFTGGLDKDSQRRWTGSRLPLWGPSAFHD